MTRAQFVLICSAIGALGAGAGLIYNLNGDIENVVNDPSMWDQINAKSCSSAGNCVSTPCLQAKNVLQDAGIACVPVLIDCDYRVSPLMRACFADAGLAIGSQLYQRLELMELRCPAVDGGFAFAAVFDDAGCPEFASAVVTPLCVRAPLDGGTSCLRDVHDGDGGKFFGTGNVFPATQVAGSNCDAVSCTVLYGDDPDQTL